MKTNTHTNGDGRLEAIAVITFFIILFFFTISVSAQPINGNSGHCRQFNGSSSRIYFTNNNLGLSSGNTMTVTAWVKCKSTTNEGKWANVIALNSSTGSGDEGQFWLQHSYNNSVFEFAVENNSANRVYVQSTTQPVTGEWYHVAGVYDGSYVKLYVNGVLEAQAAQSGKINSYSNSFRFVFGEWANSANNYRRFNGDIDEVTIWNVALTQTQVRAYMCQKLQGNETGLIGYWRMNETSGSIVGDITSNGRNGKSSSANIVWSGAPIGDASTFTYGGSSLSINNPAYGDSLVVNNFSSTPGGIQLYRIDTIPNVATPPVGYSAIANNYYYGVFIIGSTSPTYNLTYYYTSNPLVTAPVLFDISTRNDNSVMAWKDLSVTLNTGINAFQKPGVSGRGEFVPALTLGVLPIKLVSFTATPEENSVKINWTTASEINNKYFTVERTTDGINYQAIAIVQGAGNSSTVRNYTATDDAPVQGTAYYRLRQTDFDGNSQAFSPVTVTFSGNMSGNSYTVNSIYPNPFSSTFTVTVNCNSAEQLTMQIISMNGMVAGQEVINCSKGNNTYSYIKGDNLAPGTYIIYITDPSGQKTIQKVIKQ